MSKERGSFTIDEGVPGVRPGHFDIFNQTFELIGPDGSTIMAETYEIEYVRLLAARTSIIFATQLGASAILLMILLLMTPNTKRRSLSWIFNVLALVCNVIRCTLQCLEMTGPFLNFVVIATQEYGVAGLDRHIRLGIANNVITTLVFIFIELALVTQVQVICAAAMSSLCRIATLSFCGIVAAVAIGFRLNLMVVNSISTAELGVPDATEWASFNTLQWAVSTNNVTAIVSICVFSGVFCTKLGLAIRSRRSMGLKQFGAMQIVFIMGCQTLTIPVIFAILDYYAIRGAQLSSFVETLVAIFLPLSSMWATTNIKSKNIGAPMNEKNNHRAIPVGHSNLGTGGPSSYNGSKKLLSENSIVDTFDNRSPTSYYDKFPSSKQEPRNEPRVSVTAGHRLSCMSDGDEDLEMGRVGGNNIQVDKSYTVHSEPDWNVGHAR